MEKKTNKQTNNKQPVESQLGKPKLVDCKQPAIQPSGDSTAERSEEILSVVASTSSAAQALAGTPANTPASGTADQAVTPATSGQVGSSNSMSGPTNAPSTALTANENPPSRKDPSRKAFVQRRAAMRLVERLGVKSVDTLTPDEKSSLDWAKALLAQPECSDPPTTSDAADQATSAGPKRQRSEEEHALQAVPQPKTKRQKQFETRIVNRPYSEVAKNPLVRAIVDKSVNDGAISQDKWLIIRQKMLEVYWKILKENPGPSPQNDDAGWYQGHIKLLACTNERSANLLKLAVTSIGEVWPGAKLDVIPVSEIPRRPRSITVIPAEPHEPEAILAYLQSGNPDLPTHNWKVVKVSEPEGANRKAVVVLNKESLPLLREKQGKVYYGFDSIKLRVYRGDDKLDPKPVSTDGGKVDDTTNSDDQMDAQSSTDLIGNLFDSQGEVIDEDELLKTDPEDADVTIVYDPDQDEGDPSEPSPL
ncbi:uncharacterized protein LOC119616483 [Lucilia sericata]|uniref:uncharacterized protein LOC119604280 n=3 Tax=Lucilia sericata TaxID=13632 RepID=UPI0018A88209|nr:uncharacterized protein LOC119604280 [Lucilia sericata]XP_037815201.1 uncharacterized protein LOC119605922 [Lucilia sericata]XP_037820086.1 uncharacterized protein LOC119609396 [Lucilia sericata]XP_037825638.1 uncharacterized protein LOC119613686 [Lucilia sericata]XP_037826331.1 uncharacterized protein LOC119614264 [Lucilia sericata]XP_037828355.1 uncharacterized protein LOC119616158 [Lucilia sericata]XP_037828772.1 uncharacterized protein LOC119616483 [Lucilia sericata]